MANRIIRFLSRRFDLVPRSAIAETEAACATAWAELNAERYHRSACEQLLRETEVYAGSLAKRLHAHEGRR